MNRKLLFFAISCLVMLLSCSAQEDLGNFTSKPVNVEKPDTISKPADSDDDTIVVQDPVVQDPVIVAQNSIIAHRGAWKKNNFPQNSIAALKEAIRLGCKGSEFDIWFTADDSLIVNHDRIYNNLIVQNASYSQLTALKLSNGENLPTLREYIQAAKENNTTTKLVCHFQEGLNPVRRKLFATKIFECINKLKAQYLIIYASDSYALLKEIRAKDALVDTRYLMGNAFPPEQVKKDNISGIFYYDSAYTNNPEWIESARANNLTLSVSGANNIDRIKWYLKNNFDAILTDEPEFLIKLQSSLVN
ncbi:glycerophosphodiester phosphodiesterase family protein [Flavobacterium sp. 245]|uniref:glycerophosphodiester phosphodiesterase family protein n=1 Tax=Flavobacterium sp. 245 TaxID=2512115 RepID=UPI00106216EF|nr:glycerophosphodiester phosphodiesterase family protein [Flavobacterium sp. 245]TDP02436.1 glycerophosphoryl diester phosphodiesterase [Flavobacterium sp. 245]